MQKNINDPRYHNNGSQPTQRTATKIQSAEATKTYTCSMHPEVILDKPGKCPKCGMELIERK